MSPNQVSLISAAFTAVGIMLISILPPSWLSGLVITLFLVVGFMLDAADGQLARLRGTTSLAGEWLDHFLDALKMVAIHSAVFICWYRFMDIPSVLLLIPLAFQLAAVGIFAGGTLAALLRRLKPEKPESTAKPSNVRAFLLLPVDYGVFCVSFLLFGAPTIFNVTYVVLAAVHWVFLLFFIVKWFKELGSK
ncbi:CDP-alcohol phosphatidyltransferase family protein [Arthrobacter sp.]|uniref:CDP-alcohol phosphatidyltransferase family protein n=1 Tax=Arthrobacter sp. TaxID=1667 RepID=UPI003A93E47A